jgi:hypothetical protein
VSIPFRILFHFSLRTALPLKRGHDQSYRSKSFTVGSRFGAARWLIKGRAPAAIAPAVRKLFRRVQRSNVNKSRKGESQ